MDHPSIFHDPSSRRWKRLNLVAACTGAVALVFGTVFACSLWIVPRLPALPPLGRSLGRIVPRLPNRQRKLRQELARRTESELQREIRRERQPVAPSREIAAAF